MNFVEEDYSDGGLIGGAGQVLVTSRRDPEPRRSWCGRLWETVTGWSAKPLEQKIVGAVSSVATVATAAISSYQFWRQGYDEKITMACGGIIGATATTAIGTMLPYNTGAKVLDFMARWSFEGYQVATELFINALCPVTWCQEWNLQAPTPLVNYTAMLVFASLATSSIALSLRPLFFKERQVSIGGVSNELLHEEGGSGVQSPLLFQGKRINKLLESTSEAKGWFVAEQVAKACLGVPLILLPYFSTIPRKTVSDMMRFAGNFILGLIPGSILGRVYVHFDAKVNEAIEERAKASLAASIEPTTKEVAIIRIGKIASLAASLTLGGLFMVDSPYAFLGMGACVGLIKMLEQRRFEQLKYNPDEIKPFEWCKISSYAKGEFLALAITLAWYGWGLTDPSNSLEDWIDIGTMVGSACISYATVRQLLARFRPPESSRPFNSALFYAAHFPCLIFPYLFRRFAGDLKNSSDLEPLTTAIINGISWGSVGAAWGALRQVYSARSSESPSIVTLPVQILSGLILSSKGQFRVK